VCLGRLALRRLERLLEERGQRAEVDRRGHGGERAGTAARCEGGGGG
jgi:hypothetical protein